RAVASVGAMDEDGLIFRAKHDAEELRHRSVVRLICARRDVDVGHSLLRYAIVFARRVGGGVTQIDDGSNPAGVKRFYAGIRRRRAALKHASGDDIVILQPLRRASDENRRRGEGEDERDAKPTHGPTAYPITAIGVIMAP